MYNVQEFFDRASKKLFEISDDRLTVTNKSNFDQATGRGHTIYCNYPINSMSNFIYKWTFKFEGPQEQHLLDLE